MAKEHIHDENCGCGYEHEHDHDHAHENSMILTLEDDSEITCHILGNFDVADKEYIALLPENSDEVLLYRYRSDDDNVDVENIEDDEEFDMVSAVFQNILDEAMELGDLETRDMDGK